MEMLPGNFAWYRNMLPFYFLCYCGIFFFVRLKEKKERRFFYTSAEKTILFLALFFSLCTFAVLRSVEYAVPFTAAGLGILLKYAVLENTAFFEKPSNCNKMLYLFLCAVLALAVWNTNLMLKSNYSVKSPRKMAEFLKENTPENSLVINLQSFSPKKAYNQVKIKEQDTSLLRKCNRGKYLSLIPLRPYLS